MTGPTAPTPTGTTTAGTTTAPEWDDYLGRVEQHAREAEAALAAREAFCWPDVATPRSEPTAAQLERAQRLHARLATLLEAGQAHRDDLLRELSTLTGRGPGPTTGTAGALGTSLDVLG